MYPIYLLCTGMLGGEVFQHIRPGPLRSMDGARSQGSVLGLYLSVDVMFIAYTANAAVYTSGFDVGYDQLGFKSRKWPLIVQKRSSGPK